MAVKVAKVAKVATVFAIPPPTERFGPRPIPHTPCEKSSVPAETDRILALLRHRRPSGARPGHQWLRSRPTRHGIARPRPAPRSPGLLVSLSPCLLVSLPVSLSRFRVSLSEFEPREFAVALDRRPVLELPDVEHLVLDVDLGPAARV